MNGSTAQGDPGSDPVGDSVVVVDSTYASDKVDLISAVAHQLRCTAVSRTRWAEGTKERSVHLFGHASDLDVANSRHVTPKSHRQIPLDDLAVIKIELDLQIGSVQLRADRLRRGSSQSCDLV